MTSIGNSKQMPDHTRMLGLAGAFIGLGQVVGGGIFVFGSKLIEKVSRIVLLNGLEFFFVRYFFDLEL